MKKNTILAWALAVFFGCVSCASMRLQSVSSMNNTKYTMPVCKDFKAAVCRAAIGRHWGVQEVGPNVLRCTLNVRGHSVVVDVVNDGKNFSVVYVDSSNMMYDANADVINHRYHHWVRNLVKDIQVFASQQ